MCLYSYNSLLEVNLGVFNQPYNMCFYCIQLVTCSYCIILQFLVLGDFNFNSQYWMATVFQKHWPTWNCSLKFQIGHSLTQFVDFPTRFPDRFWFDLIPILKFETWALSPRGNSYHIFCLRWGKFSVFNQRSPIPTKHNIILKVVIGFLLWLYKGYAY